MKEVTVNFINEVKASSTTPIKLGFIGLGKTNYEILDAVCRHCSGIHISIRQSSPIDRLPDSVPKNLRIITGSDALSNLDEDVIFLSPSVRRESLVCKAEAILTSDTDLFFSEKRKNTFAVTGSDGKSTVTTLVSELLRPTFPTLFVGGNIGVPLVKADLKQNEAFVLELSSFNLRYVRPEVSRALITRITPNHLNWHDSYDEYVESKLNLTRSADKAIFNIDTPYPTLPDGIKGCFAICSRFTDEREIRSTYHPQHAVTLRDGKIIIDSTPVLDIIEIKRSEGHNISNLTSAIAMTIGYTDTDVIRQVAGSFSGLEHRCEKFLIYDKITFINSSIDTSPERTRATLESLNERVTLILGGRGKGLDPTPLISPVAKYAKKIAIYGDIREELLELIESRRELVKIPHASFEQFEDALEYATESLKRGDTLLLSPAATAYGQFRDFAERGRYFKAYINRKYSKI